MKNSGRLVRIRPFQDDDRSALDAIYKDCRNEAAWLPQAIKRRADFSRDTEGEIILVAVNDEGEPEGFISVWEPDGFIHHLYVRRCSRRRGIGEALLAALEEAGVPKPWRLKCQTENAVAMAFYTKRAWKEIAQGMSDDGRFAVMERI